MPVNVDLNGLYAFRALVEYGSFRSAAESICLSQSALSRRIEKLEAALGARLFERTTRRVTLTLYGQTFAERSDQLLANFEEVMADVSKVSQERTGLVTVATVPSAAYYFMPDVIRLFQARYPRVRVKLIDSSVGNVIEAVMNGQADFGICFSGNPLPNTEFLPLVEDAYVAACRRDSPLATRDGLTWREFYQQEYVSLDKVSGNRNLLDQALGDIIPARPSLCETRHVTTLLGMVEAGIGIAAVPAMSMPPAEHSVLMQLPLTEPAVTRTVGLLKRSGRIQSYVAAELEQLITERYLAAERSARPEQI
ncbi:LysR substrate-binding domain-containing protein [Serratia rhizosphaerae]|uniref:LysR family transcriptional regulator n=1 Tax=unclassified Serratia (in: enterobacteria) TaxID=2647522 RepID=UPI000CF5FC67|nr:MULTISPECIES: LysR family transcriptional regulator [unclassified Serratia (in: enterobacteria)]AVJ19219.1 LysR family transcriptional regulator [Serratia sp. MYb239]MCA4825491.1 LysR family transcriptional regulator [Serratia rubidaea]QNK33173.1 LysR family transcriptional regulator [Serratia sp. JUb9]SQJ08254.1 Morphology and auto-aggregation control protein [Serratia rubidaea]